MLTPTTAFAFCDPTKRGLSYTLDGTTLNDAAGILNECWIFRNRTFVDAAFNGSDSGGVQLLDPTFTPGAFYNGVCQEHGKQSGSLDPQTGLFKISGFSDSGPSPSDVECTGGDQVLDGTY